jgi:hypothetical protein
MIGYTSTTGPLRLGLLGFVACLALTGNARADDRDREHHEDARSHHEVARERHVFREHDVHRFNAEELGRWRGGQWKNSCFGGRCGWWWFAEGQWFFYDRPVYPYPLVVSDAIYVEPVPAAVIGAPPPAVYVAPPPAAYAPPPQPVAPPGAPQVYYYCDNPPGYYPTVPSCPTQFRVVPAPR